ncbi:type II toxin-antitoxin system RelE/ParE family toxin [Rhodobium gokarnense]|uniref:Toxin n=1 Tax=Rhodobium gokarnense TaxID=364296 RepID=A0ABT3HAG2_9HYPH|nr:type II toxin-antitoxin system RelE/ParE family toxin [Rhodobium gokarnense]MCW2307380.1 toxin ParE1/3/4 [Rhodobium gokarnense]
MDTWFLSLDAEEDIQDIYIYSEGKWGEDQARRYVFSLYDVFATIGDNPRIGRLRRELGDGIRSLPHASHIVFFMEWQGETAIVRVLHKSRDFEDLFGTYNPLPGIEESQR